MKVKFTKHDTPCLRLGRSEVLRSMKYYLRAESHRHLAIDRLEERGMERDFLYLLSRLQKVQNSEAKLVFKVLTYLFLLLIISKV